MLSIKNKKGRSIDSIQFHIVKKANWKDENYKRNDVQAQLTGKNKIKLKIRLIMQ